MPNKSVPRLAIYGVGQYGQHIVRMATDKGWQVVAAYNRAGAKIGQDLGRLAGLERDLDVFVQDCDQADYGALRADIGVVAVSDRIADNFAAYERLLSAGLNVICHGTESINPAVANPQVAQAIDQLARRNNVTFTGTGIWDMSRIWSGILIAGPCTDIVSLFHVSVTDIERFGKEFVLATGVGMSVAEFDEKIAKIPIGKVSGFHRLAPALVMSGLGYHVLSSTERREPVVSPRPFFCKTLARELEPGVCLGMRSVVETKTEEGVTALARIEARVLFNEGEAEHMMWKVNGSPPTKITVERQDSAHLSAASLFNRIRDVIAAPAGIQLITTLGPLKHTALG